MDSVAAKTLIVGIDRSKSDSDYLLGPAALGTSLLIARLDPQTDRVLVFRVEHDTDLILGPEIPQNSDDLQRALVEQLMADPKQPGSFTADFWEKIAIAAEKAPGRSSSRFIQTVTQKARRLPRASPLLRNVWPPTKRFAPFAFMVVRAGTQKTMHGLPHSATTFARIHHR